MKVEEGTIIEITGQIAKIRVGKHSDCVSCGACPGSDSPIIDADNKIGAKVGQRVLYEVVDTYKVKSALIIFAAPLIFAFLGVFAGGAIAGSMGWEVLTAKIVGGITAFVIAGILIKLFDSHVGKKANALPEIKSIVR